MSLEDIKKYTGLSETTINDVIQRRQDSSEGSV
jgi:biotin operon repressor